MITFFSTVTHILKPSGREDWGMWLGLPLMAMIGLFTMPDYWTGDPIPPWTIRGLLALIAGFILGSRFHALVRVNTAQLIPGFFRQLGHTIVLLTVFSALLIHIYSVVLWQASIHEFGLVLALVWGCFVLCSGTFKWFGIIPLYLYGQICVLNKTQPHLMDQASFKLGLWMIGLLTLATMLYFLASLNSAKKREPWIAANQGPLINFSLLTSLLPTFRPSAHGYGLLRISLFSSAANLGLPTLLLSPLILSGLSVLPATRSADIVGTTVGEQTLIIGAFLWVGSTAVNNYLIHTLTTRRHHLIPLWMTATPFESRQDLVRGILKTLLRIQVLHLIIIHLPFYVWLGWVWKMPLLLLTFTQGTVILWCVAQLIALFEATWTRTRYYDLNPGMILLWASTALFTYAIHQLSSRALSLTPAFIVFWTGLLILATTSWHGAISKGSRVDWHFKKIS